MIHSEDIRQALRDAADKREQDVAAFARRALIHLEEGDYSAAAASCHRAHQQKLIVAALRDEAAR
jgi:hypothetical protein